MIYCLIESRHIFQLLFIKNLLANKYMDSDHRIVEFFALRPDPITVDARENNLIRITDSEINFHL